MQGVVDGIGQGAHLGEAVFKADVQVIGVGGEKALVVVLVQDGQGADVDPVVVVGEVQAREHAANEGALAGARLADDADELVRGVEVELYQVHPQGVHPLAAPGGEVGADDMACLTFDHRGGLLFPFRSPGPV